MRFFQPYLTQIQMKWPGMGTDKVPGSTMAGFPGRLRGMRRRPAPPSAQQMIRDYLGQVSSAAQRLLPKGDRLLFVGRTRAAIEARVGPLGSADADAVAAALTALGDPEDLAKQERERLYSAQRRAGATPQALWKPAKESRRGTRPPPPRPRSGDGPPWKPRPWPSRGRAAIPEAPGDGAAPQPGQAPAGRPDAAAARPAAAPPRCSCPGRDRAARRDCARPEPPASAVPPSHPGRAPAPCRCPGPGCRRPRLTVGCPGRPA